MAGVKVLQVLTRFGAGGAPLVVVHLARELNRAGYQTGLVSGQCSQEDLDLSYILNGEDSVEWVPEMSRSVALRSDLVALWRLYRIMRMVRPSIVQTHTAKAGALGRIAARLAGVPVVIHTFHGHVLSGYFSKPVSFAIRVAERVLAKFTDAICVLAPQQATDLAERFGVTTRERIHVIPLGLELEPFQKLPPPPWSDGVLTVGWLGRLVEIKDILLLVKVMEENLRQSVRIRFIIAGDGQQRSLIQGAVQRWGDRIRWLGWSRDVTGIIAQCDVLVQTSRSEGTPIALIQGMAAGRPFVSTPAGGVIDMVSGPRVRETRGCRWYSNGALVDPDPAAFASALSDMQRDSGLVARMGQKAAEFASAHYNLVSLAANYDRLYSNLLASKKRTTSAEPRVARPLAPGNAARTVGTAPTGGNAHWLP